MKDIFLKIQEQVMRAGKILIISHRSPDADTLGGAVALKIWMERLNKCVTMASFDSPSSRFAFLPRISEFVSEFELNEFNLLVIVDSGASYMTNFHLKYPNLFTSGLPIINIDHHSSNDNFGTLNLVDVNASSATVLIYQMFLELNVEIDADIATCLLAGIYNDTGSFMHCNTDENAYSIAGDLVNLGARIGDIASFMFNRNSIRTLRLWGRVFENVEKTDDDIVLSVIRDSDYDDVEAGPENLSGVIDYLSMVPDTKFAILVNEDRNGNVKGSLRSRSDVDVSYIASVFGGGGHTKASGFKLQGKLK